jgi:radical SAM superfamily enzyme YgiQ (UPF0313 family)
MNQFLGAGDIALRGACSSSILVNFTLTKKGKLDPPEAILARAFRSLGCSEVLSNKLSQMAYAVRLDPNLMAHVIAESLHSKIRHIHVTGSIERRVIFLQGINQRWFIAHLGPEPVGAISWPAAVAKELSFNTPSERVSEVTLAQSAIQKIYEPHVKLIALYHPEVFPVPRFPLGISDIARAIRVTLRGRVTMCDMQLGATLDDISNEINDDKPDIIGISATFGQHDILETLLERVPKRDSGGPLIILGGSLPALNASILLDQYPSIFVASGNGEVTMQDLVAYWHGELRIDEISGIYYKLGDKRFSTTREPNRFVSEYLPELDLLSPILRRGGVMQLESSRGCTHACSFCPRDHKGQWSGGGASKLEIFLEEINEVYEQFPQISRKLFLVDEEFIGKDRNGSVLDRAKEISASIKNYGFRWETSARIDQVYRLDRDMNWHVDRMHFWNYLRKNGLDRCLFGIESGVDSILQRFNKHTTAAQNIYALRLLSACGIPIRCTYITFDPLMTMEELIESYLFQGRTDLLLKPVNNLTFEDIFSNIHDEGFAREYTSGLPMYSQISYMLVSMECLIGSHYLRKVEIAGLAREVVPSMGKRNAIFRDPMIGLMSIFSQLWVDRNFSYDYTLKSLEKITRGEERIALRHIRQILKRSSYRLLGEMLVLATHPVPAGLEPTDKYRKLFIDLMDELFVEIVDEIDQNIDSILPILTSTRRKLLIEHTAVWRVRTSWDLINGS